MFLNFYFRFIWLGIVHVHGRIDEVENGRLLVGMISINSDFIARLQGLFPLEGVARNEWRNVRLSSWDYPNRDTHSFCWEAPVPASTTLAYHSKKDVIAFQEDRLWTLTEVGGELLVFTKFDGEKEYLYYEITKLDDKKRLFPEAYKSLDLGLMGLVDDFNYLNKNNALIEKYYEEDGSMYHSADNTFEYNNTSQPTKLMVALNESGLKSTSVKTYQYSCK